MTQRGPRVVVLGAGASCSYRDSPTGLTPPLAREIIRTYFGLDISENRYVLIGDIVNYVRDYRGIAPWDFASWDEDMERLMTEMDETRRSLASKLRYREDGDATLRRFILSSGAYNQLVFLLASIFNEIQNGPVCDPYFCLASKLGPRDTIVTFNWDTLMDRALMATGKWSARNGYHIQPELIFDDGWKELQAFKSPSCGPEYLKLHGSTNWLTPYHGLTYSTGEFHTLSSHSMDKLFVFLKASRSYETYEGRYWGPYQPFSYCYYPPNLPVLRNHTPGRSSIRMMVAPDLPGYAKVTIDDKQVYSMPLIIPPVRHKEYATYGKIFSGLWAAAETAVASCRELFVIGYSFPATDLASRDMFSRALRTNGELDKVIVINPQPQGVEALFLDEFGVSRSTLEVRAERFDVSPDWQS